MQRYFAKKINENTVTLLESDLHHIYKVMRMKEEDLIEVVFEKKLYLASIGEKITIKEEIEYNREQSDINLIVPLLKEQKLDIILQKSTELGVSSITVIPTERTIVKMDSKKEDRKVERWQKICKEAAEQSKRVTIPNVSYQNKLHELEGACIICVPDSDISIKNHLKNKNLYDKINVLIGPEGGFSDKEVKMFEKIGFKRVNLGSRIMRAETVPLFIMSIINYENME